jgi:hypothetical protein
MTGSDDEMTAALTRTLRHRAEEAPSLDGLTEKAMAIASRRRRVRLNASIAAVMVVAVGVPMAIVMALSASKATPAAQPDWRWESYRTVQVQVPPDWGYGVPGRAWCVGTTVGENYRIRPGAVGRPGPIFMIACPSEYPPVHRRESWLSLGSGKPTGQRTIDHGWVEETRQVDGVSVTVFTNDDTLRAAILGSARPIDGTDHYGCPSDHPVTGKPGGYRPDDGGLPPASTVRSISVCRYALDSAPPLLSSSRLTGADARQVVADILAAPRKSPDTETDGNETIVLRVDTTDGVREVVVHYSGMSVGGFDDGTTKRDLTADALRPLLTGANAPTEMSPTAVTLLQR